MQNTFTDNRHNYINKKYNLSPVSLLDEYKESDQVYKDISFKNLYGIYESNAIQNSVDMIKNCSNLSLPFDIPTELTIRVAIITDYEKYLSHYNFLKEKTKSEESFYGYMEQRIIKNWFHNSFQNFYQHDIKFVKPSLEKIEKTFGDVYSIDKLIDIIPKTITMLGVDFLHEESQDIKIFLDAILLVKKIYYPKSYIKELKRFGLSEDEIYRYLVCNYKKKEDLHKRPLGKLINDISEELDLL